MAEITIILDNSLNSSDANPPGFSLWVGGQEHGDTLGIKVDKTDTALAFKLIPVDYLQTWYYEYGWISGANITGPFVDGQTIQLGAVTK